MGAGDACRAACDGLIQRTTGQRLTYFFLGHFTTRLVLAGALLDDELAPLEEEAEPDPLPITMSRSVAFASKNTACTRAAALPCRPPD